mgnify:CR=1 FL=1
MLKQMYRQVLIGFEEFSFDEKQILSCEGEFSFALHDLKACLSCDGKCRTSINFKCANPREHCETGIHTGECYPGNSQMYYALYYRACKDYKLPIFAFFYCEGPEWRRAIISQLRESRKHSDAEVPK